VTNPRVEGLYQAPPTPDSGVRIVGEVIYIPEDDQHLRDLDMLTTEFARFAGTGDPLGLKHEAAMRLRAWVGLDQEGDTFRSEEWGRLNQSMWEDDMSDADQAVEVNLWIIRALARKRDEARADRDRYRKALESISRTSVDPWGAMAARDKAIAALTATGDK